MTRKEKKRRLQELRRMNKEQLMQLYYARMEMEACSPSANSREHVKIFNECKGTPIRKRVRAKVTKCSSGSSVYAINAGNYTKVVCKVFK